jgi:hypothetical protein
MDTAAARVDPEILDAIQIARGKVPLSEFRLLPDCATCNHFADGPPTSQSNSELQDHIRTDHADLVIVSSD